MNTKRYIFLDIDGVLNSGQWYKFLRDTKTKQDILKMTFNEYNIDYRAVQLLNQLKECEVVISSSWSYRPDTIQALRDAGLTLPIIGGIEHLECGSSYICRGNSIAKWFKDKYDCVPLDNYFKPDGFYHTKQTYSGNLFEMTEDPLPEDNVAITYVIIDDDQDMLYEQKDHFVHVDSITGLTQLDIDHCKMILNLMKY